MPAEMAGRCHPVRPVAVLQIGGTQDPVMPFGGGPVADFGGRGEGGEVLSFAQTGSFWAQANGCRRPGPPQALPIVAPLDPTRVTSAQYTHCPAQGTVELVTVNGGGHTWPGGPQYARPIAVGLASRQIDASDMIAAFFMQRPLRQ